MQLKNRRDEAPRESRDEMPAACRPRRAAGAWPPARLVWSVLMSGVAFLLLTTRSAIDSSRVGRREGTDRLCIASGGVGSVSARRHAGAVEEEFSLSDGRSAMTVLWLLLSCRQSHVDAAGDKATARKLKAVLEKHGLDLHEVEAQMKKDRSLDSFAKELSLRVKDKEEFFDEAMTVLASVLPKPESKDGRPVIAYGPLKKIEVVGDRAKGEFIKQLDARTVLESDGVRLKHVAQGIEFRRISGRWLCHMGGGY